MEMGLNSAARRADEHRVAELRFVLILIIFRCILDKKEASKLKRKISATRIATNTTESIWIDTVKKCPVCHTAHSGTNLNAFLISKELSIDPLFPKKHTLLYVIYLCEACEGIFLSLYAREESSRTSEFLLIDSVPKITQAKEFDSRIQNVSPRFIKIYSQAQKAEEEKLDEIAGMGYRKALECLIKDYLIQIVHKDPETVINTFLGKCITDMVDNPYVKKVAEKCAWVGNDFSHYLNERDEGLQTLKDLIDATVYWVCMECVTLEAEAISRK